MPSLTLDIKYEKNTGLVMSANEILDLYLYGVKIQSTDGTDLQKETIEFYIKAAQSEIEQYLKIKLNKQFFEDSASYYREDYINNFPIVKSRYPVNEALSLVGMYNKVEQITYPKEWLQSHKNTDGVYLRRISIVPSASTSVNTSQDFILTGLTSQFGLGSYGNVPDYWHYQYITGFDSENMPMELLNIVGMLSSIGLLNVAGDIALGQAALASFSISLDGMSNSVGTTNSATSSAFTARILQYKKNIDETLDRVKGVYREYNWTVV